MSRDTGKDSVSPSVKRLAKSLPGRIALIMLITWATSAIIPLILRVNRAILPAALQLASVAGVGLVAGLATRGCLNQRTLVLKLVTAFLALTSGLWLSGVLTAGSVGFRLFPRSDISIDWMGLSQLALGCLAAGLALYAWRISLATKIAARQASSRLPRLTVPSRPKRAKSKTIKSGRTSKPRKSSSLDHLRPLSRKRTPTASSRKTPAAATRRSVQVVPRNNRKSHGGLRGVLRNFGSAQTRFWENTRASLSSGMRSIHKSGQAMQTSLRTASSVVQLRLRESGRAVQKRLQSSRQTARTQLHSRNDSKPAESTIQLQNRPRNNHSARAVDSPVHLVGETEHRCPYCLEVVVRNDRRGIVVCPICHTHHHADCWAITGTCQVPHQYE